MKASVRCTRPQYVCANERMKLIGTTDGYFPDFGHHLENEMGGLWLYPVKLLDGFWLRFTDHTAKTVDCWTHADQFMNYPHKNEFLYNNGLGHTTVKIRRTQIVPDDVLGVIVTYEFYNAGSNACECTTEFVARTDLRPVWMSKDAGIFDGASDDLICCGSLDENCMDGDQPVFVAKDCDHSWYVAIGCDTPADKIRHGQFFGPENTVGNGISVGMTHHFTLEPGKSRQMKFYISGSDTSFEQVRQAYEQLEMERDFEAEKKARYESLFKTSSLSTPDARFNEIFNWVKVHTDWLTTATSNGNRGIAAGIPEYPWWFGCDSFYTLQGVLCMGDYQLCRDTLKLILDYSIKYNGNGRIVHEILTNEVCPNYGNTQETAHFITMIWKYYEWTGDFSLVEEAFEYMGKSIEWLKAQDDDHDLFPTGYGIIEIAGLNMELIDTAVYTCEAYECYGKMCALMAGKGAYTGENQAARLQAMASECGALADKTKDAINTLLWNEEEGLYCDAYTSYGALENKKAMIMEMLETAQCAHIKAYVERLFEERKNDGNKEKGWLLNRNWVINVPLETGIATKAQAERALANMHTSDFIGPHGMYLDAMCQSAAMTISTGVMAVAQAQYGYADRALELIERIFGTFGMATPGSISEMSPDYGCFVQAWTTYGVMLPVVRHFFGIQPSASLDQVILKPCLPSKWNQASMEHVKVFGGEMSMEAQLCDQGMKIKVTNTSGKPVCVELDCPFTINGVSCVSGTVCDAREFELIYKR